MLEMESNDDIFVVASGGYLYVWNSSSDMEYWVRTANSGFKPNKRKLP